jgi:hypothetical protein
MEVLKKGSVEPLLVAMRDRLTNLSTLASVTNLVFRVHDKEDDSEVQPDTTVLLDVDYPMTAICQIDTTLIGYVPGHTFKLYLQFDDGSSSPILGPEEFRVEDD